MLLKHWMESKEYREFNWKLSFIFRMICGSRVRVEFSHGRGRSNRGGRVRRRSGSRSPRSRKPYSPHDVCYECGGEFFFFQKQTKFIILSN